MCQRKGKDYILNGQEEKCKVMRDLVIHVQSITVAYLSIVNVNNPHMLIRFACNVRLAIMCNQ